MVPVMLQTGPLNIFIFKIIEPICGYSDKQKEKNPPEANASRLVTGVESLTVAVDGLPSIWPDVQTPAREKEGPWALSRCISMCLTNCILKTNKNINFNFDSFMD